jgi:hypothetical protein
MCRLLPVPQYWKDMKDKFQRLSSILKETRFYLQVLIKLQDFGTLKLANVSRLLRDMRTKFSHACSTMKVTPLSQVPRTIHAKFGGIVKSTRKSESLVNFCVNYCFKPS